jgi:hypothetical protein
MYYFCCQHPAIGTKWQIALNAEVTQRKLMIQTHLSIFGPPDLPFDSLCDAVCKGNNYFRVEKFRKAHWQGAGRTF